MKKYLLMITFFCFSNQLFSDALNPQCMKHIPLKLIQSFDEGVDWKIYFHDTYKKALACNDQANIGIVNTIDKDGYPVGLPIHFEFKKGSFYFAQDHQSQRNQNLKINPKVSLLIYYRSIDQSSFLIKGNAIPTPIQYQYAGKSHHHTQIIYKIDPEEINISFLNPSTRVKEEIIRHLYVYKKKNPHEWSQSKRFIHIHNLLDDLEETFKQKNILMRI